MQKLIIFTAISGALLTSAITPSFAQDNASQEKTIHITSNPELVKGNEEYKAKLETLSAPQKAKLEKFDELITKTHEPEFSLTSNYIQFNACKEMDPSITAPHEDDMIAYKLKKQVELSKNFAKLGQEKRKLDFISPELLTKHQMASRDLQTQLIAGMGKIVAGQIKTNKDTAKCQELMNTLKAENTPPYFTKANMTQPGFSNRTILDKKMCSLGMQHNAPSGDRLSVAMLFFKAEGKPSLEISTKILAPSPDEEINDLPIEMSWLNFGAVNTMFWSRRIQPYPSLFIMKMSDGTIVNVLKEMQEYPVYASVKHPDWENDIVFEHKFNDAEIANMAECAKTIDPRLAEAFKKVGL